MLKAEVDGLAGQLTVMRADLDDRQREFTACKADRHATEQAVWHADDDLKKEKITA